jgi:hypothetical protein
LANSGKKFFAHPYLLPQLPKCQNNLPKITGLKNTFKNSILVILTLKENNNAAQRKTRHFLSVS